MSETIEKCRFVYYLKYILGCPEDYIQKLQGFIKPEPNRCKQCYEIEARLSMYEEYVSVMSHLQKIRKQNN